MLTFITRRLLLLIPTVLGVVTLTFFAVRAGGVSPALVMLPKAPPEVILELEKKNGWDKPLTTQYFRYLERACHLDFGKNLVVSSHTVFEELKTRFPATIELSLAALFIAILIGIPIGILAAVKNGSWLDYSSMTIALAGVSFPVFWLAMLLIMMFGQSLPFNGRINPHMEESWQFVRHTNFLVWDTLWYGNWPLLRNVLLHLILPATALATIPLASIARITRTSLLDVLGEDYIRTAKSKGLSPLFVIIKHAMKNAMPHINTAVGLQTGSLLGGAILTESIFRWNGVGTYVVDSALNHDYNGTQGGVILLALVFVAVNLVVDLSYAWFDPRVRVQ